MARVLLIDDEPAVQLVLQQMLQAGGHSVLLAKSGNELLNDLQTADYDVVITDLYMPVIDGWDVAAWLRERRPGVPIIAIGGDVQGRKNAPMDVFSAVLMKPFRREQLLTAISTALPRGTLSG